MLLEKVEVKKVVCKDFARAFHGFGYGMLCFRRGKDGVEVYEAKDIRLWVTESGISRDEVVADGLS